MAKITIKTNGKDLKKGTYKATPAEIKKYRIKENQKLAKTKSKTKNT